MKRWCPRRVRTRAQMVIPRGTAVRRNSSKTRRPGAASAAGNKISSYTPTVAARSTHTVQHNIIPHDDRVLVAVLYKVTYASTRAPYVVVVVVVAGHYSFVSRTVVVAVVVIKCIQDRTSPHTIPWREIVFSLYVSASGGGGRSSEAPEFGPYYDYRCGRQYIYFRYVRYLFMCENFQKNFIRFFLYHWVEEKKTYGPCPRRFSRGFFHQIFVLCGREGSKRLNTYYFQATSFREKIFNYYQFSTRS